MKIWMNGDLIEEKEAVVSVYDHGFLYGMGLFETFRTYNGHPFLLREHMERIRTGCEELGIPLLTDESGMRDRVKELLEANGMEDAYFRYAVSAGVDMLGLPGGALYENPGEILYIKSLPQRSQDEPASRPLQLLTLRRNTPESGRRHKSFHYMNNILAKREMMNYPWAHGAEGLFLTDNGGFVAEGIVSNIFWIQGSVCFTPSLAAGILPGITRAFVLKLAEKEGLEVREGLFPWTALCEADEIFVTNSIQEIVSVNELFDERGGSVTVPRGKAGPVTSRLAQLYREYTRLL
ncbi:aminodeoxychorismate lyase [Paenibacillus sp. 1P03SA]|uniref:aminodeoxychorismate lyase n=1 Tax=Paenibacillus sp. 1P03SA TaxID=3132294 RepID=UPI0039A1951F